LAFERRFPSVRLTLIRHGPTEWNAARRFQGRSDVPLSTLGGAHARAIAAVLQREGYEKVYASDLCRALETARIIAEASGAQLVTDPRLREFDFGRWEGLTWEEIVAAYPALGGRTAAAAKHYAPDEGESFADVRQRVQAFLDELLLDPTVAPVAVVTHAGPLHAFFAALGLEDSSFSTGGISRVAIAGGHAQLITLNDLGHLEFAH
jgi:broad specificity phosphatase PhoE